MVVLLACLGSTWFMLGVIVLVQVVHYPLFGLVGEGAFPGYHAAHSRRITWVVLPPMAIELASSAWLVFVPSPGSGRMIAVIGFATALATWLVTAFVSVPLHSRLANGFDGRTLATLVRTNGIRTAAWLAHAAVTLEMTVAALTR